MLNNYITEPNCKYRLPCGWCDRRNAMCTELGYGTNRLTINDPNISWRNVNIPEACRNCHSHPSNGGSGLCSCSLAYPSTSIAYGTSSVSNTTITAEPGLSIEDMSITISKDDINDLLTETEGEIN